MHVATGRNGRIGEWAKDTTKNTQHKMKTITKININNMCTWNSRIRIVNSLSLSLRGCLVLHDHRDLERGLRRRTRSTRPNAFRGGNWLSKCEATQVAASLKSLFGYRHSARLSSARLGSARLGSALENAAHVHERKLWGKRATTQVFYGIASAHQKTLKCRKNSVQIGERERERERALRKNFSFCLEDRVK